jgi:hypothetical protein
VAAATRRQRATWRAGNKKERSSIASLFFIALIIFPSEIFHLKSSHLKSSHLKSSHLKSSI